MDRLAKLQRVIGKFQKVGPHYTTVEGRPKDQPQVGLYRDAEIHNDYLVSRDPGVLVHCPNITLPDGRTIGFVGDKAANLSVAKNYAEMGMFEQAKVSLTRAVSAVEELLLPRSEFLVELEKYTLPHLDRERLWEFHYRLEEVRLWDLGGPGEDRKTALDKLEMFNRYCQDFCREFNTAVFPWKNLSEEKFTHRHIKEKEIERYEMLIKQLWR